MKVLRSDLATAEAKGILQAGQADALWTFLGEVHADEAEYSFAHAAYYFGAFLILGAMGWFMTLGWAMLGGFGIAVLSGIYGALFLMAGISLRNRASGAIPGALLVTCAVWMVPLCGYGVLEMFGFWSSSATSSYRSYYQYIDPAWLALEALTIVASALAFSFVRHTFVLFPAALAAWFVSMDAVKFLGLSSSSGAMVIGAGMILVAYLIDRTWPADHAFWFYLFGATAFWGGVSSSGSGSELGKFVYSLFNVCYITLGVFLRRRPFAVYGGLGVFGYLGHLSWTIFKDSFFFPIALTGLGLLFIALGVRIDRMTRSLDDALAKLPPWVLALRPAAR